MTEFTMIILTLFVTNGWWLFHAHGDLLSDGGMVWIEVMLSLMSILLLLRIGYLIINNWNYKKD